MGGTAQITHAQAEVRAWGNLRGIRVNGQLMKFGTRLSIVSADSSDTVFTAKEQQTPSYVHAGNRRIIKTALDSVDVQEIVTDEDRGTANIKVQFSSRIDTTLTGAYLHLSLPTKDYKNGSLQIIKTGETESSKVSLNQTPQNEGKKIVQTEANGLQFSSADRQLEIQFSKPTQILVKQEKKEIDVFLRVMSGKISKGETAKNTFTFNASGTIDDRPVTLQLDPSKTGRTFAGIGGNFRLQNPRLDPKVISYNLNHLRVAWGRVELPWRAWQSNENIDPIKAAEQGKLDPNAKASMKMAQRLSDRGIPIILSAWYPPQWAVLDSLHLHAAPGVWGNALDSAKTQQIYASITKYIRYLKDQFDLGVRMFSFNESDLGINVRQTPEEHNRLIKGLGAYFSSHGLNTKLLLGDTSDANAFDFIKPAMNDSSAHKYIGALSFHSWRGWTDSTLQRWANAAKKGELPLIVGEGSIDAAAWHYPQIFLEPSYARQEINLYVRMLKICQPTTILQWQLTSDYANLAGGGLWGNEADSLHPTQRFWNLKQLGSTPEGLHFLPVHSNRDNVTAAAMGDQSTQTYAVHLVNNGAKRPVTLDGLPERVRELKIFVTDENRNMKEGTPVPVQNGEAHFTLPATSFTSLMTGNQ